MKRAMAVDTSQRSAQIILRERNQVGTEVDQVHVVYATVKATGHDTTTAPTRYNVPQL